MEGDIETALSMGFIGITDSTMVEDLLHHSGRKYLKYTDLLM